MKTQNNIEEKADDLSKIRFRYLITRRKEKLVISWCSPKEKQFVNVDSKPVLQYSLDAGCTWTDVPTVTIVEDRDE